MSDDPMDTAEQIDEDMMDVDPITSDEQPVDMPPDRPLGIPFADADVTDESLADRAAREVPEVWERAEADGTESDDRVDDDVVELRADMDTLEEPETER